MQHAAYNIACKMQHSGVCSSASERSDAFAIGGVNAVVDRKQEHRDCSAVIRSVRVNTGESLQWHSYPYSGMLMRIAR